LFFFCDAISGVTLADREIAEILRKSQKIVDGVEKRLFCWLSIKLFVTTTNLVANFMN
jgi:hypothetical protein